MEKKSPMLPSASRALLNQGKYVTMSMVKKVAIVKLVEGGRSQADVAEEFQISRQTLSDYMKNKQKILEAAEKSTGCHQKNVSQGTFPKLEELQLLLQPNQPRQPAVSPNDARTTDCGFCHP